MNIAVASFTSAGPTKTSTKPICHNFMTENGCNKGGQCTFLHPSTVLHCLRCGSTKHSVSDCKRPKKDSAASSSIKGKGRVRTLLCTFSCVQRIRRSKRQSQLPLRKFYPQLLCLVHDAENDSACTFYIAFTPAFHYTEPTDEDGILPPILDKRSNMTHLPRSLPAVGAYAISS